MQVRLPIGDFAKMTHLSVKALRHYHDVGVLEPAQVDPWSGYRFYEPDQIPVAQVIRRFRELGMPLEEVKAVLQAPDVGSRNDVIVAHLERMESQLAQTQAVVASLRSLLERPAPAVRGRVPRRRAARGAGHPRRGDRGRGPGLVGGGVHRAVRGAGGGGDRARRAGRRAVRQRAVRGGEGRGGGVRAGARRRAGGLAGAGRAAVIDVPAAELAMTLHEGPFADLDRTYGALGTYVAERELGVDGPIREYYLVAPWDTDDESAHRTRGRLADLPDHQHPADRPSTYLGRRRRQRGG